jgi:zinc transporter 9
VTFYHVYVPIVFNFINPPPPPPPLNSYYTGLPYFDALASCGVGITLGCVAVYLARMNQRFLLGSAVDSHIVNKIRSIILARPSIEAVHSIQTQWLGPSAFSFKAEVDFDGTYPAARLMTNYAPVFHEMQMRNTMDEDLPIVLGWYVNIDSYQIIFNFFKF